MHGFAMSFWTVPRVSTTCVKEACCRNMGEMSWKFHSIKLRIFLKKILDGCFTEVLFQVLSKFHIDICCTIKQVN